MTAIAERLRDLQGTEKRPPYLLALMFGDPDIDDSAVSSELGDRLDTILTASASGAAGLLHFGGILSGWQERGFWRGFKDPVARSNNQWGRFLTAVHLGYRPEKGFMFAHSQSSFGTFYGSVSGVPLFEGICCRLIVGHEQVGDDKDQASIRQFLSPDDGEVRKFYTAVGRLGSGDIDMNLVSSLLTGIKIGKGQGNSKQDLMLSLCGYKFGTLIRKGTLMRLKEGSSWVRSNLCDTPP